MTYYLDGARACQEDLEKKGLWQAVPERRAEFLRVQQLLQKCADSLSVALENNRLQIAQERAHPSVWRPLGKN